MCQQMAYEIIFNLSFFILFIDAIPLHRTVLPLESFIVENTDIIYSHFAINQNDNKVHAVL